MRTIQNNPKKKKEKEKEKEKRKVAWFEGGNNKEKAN